MLVYKITQMLFKLQKTIAIAESKKMKVAESLKNKLEWGVSY
jgi:hypothetical protein